jgi:hypothetical protein
MSDQESYNAAYGESVRLYHYTVAGSVLLAFFCLSIRHLCLRDLIGAPNLAAQFYFVIGTLQFVFALLDMTIFLPHCPNECLDYCSNKYKHAYFVYPAMATGLGVLLYREADYHRQKAKSVSGDGSNSITLDEHGNPIMFQRIPEMELQDTI